MFVLRRVELGTAIQNEPRGRIDILDTFICSIWAWLQYTSISLTVSEAQRTSKNKTKTFSVSRTLDLRALENEFCAYVYRYVLPRVPFLLPKYRWIPSVSSTHGLKNLHYQTLPCRVSEPTKRSSSSIKEVCDRMPFWDVVNASSGISNDNDAMFKYCGWLKSYNSL